LENNRISILLITFLSVLTLILLLFPLCECCKKTELIKNVETILSVPTDTGIATIDTVNVKIDTTVKKSIYPAPQKSKFSQYSFGGKSADEGKKIVCMFAPGCDHCRATAAEICKISKNNKIPEVFILFMDEEPEKINDFFKEVGCTYPYKIIGISEFWIKLGKGANTPGVFYLWNGNIIKSYEGNANNKFNANDLQNTLSKPGK
jgi:thiol-disulfide isomerase/thioredoxin